MKKIISVFIILTLAVSLISCGNTPSTTITEEYVTVIDHAGNSVKVPKNIERIAVHGILPLPSCLAVFFDSAEKIVAMPETSMLAAKNGILSELYPEILNADTSFISNGDINIEELLKTNPDVVFYLASDKNTYEKLKTSGIPAVGVSPIKWEYNPIETLNQWISLLSQMFPENDKILTVQKTSKDIYNKVQERVSKLPDNEQKKVFFLYQYSENSIMTSGDNFFGDWWADSIGAINVGKELKGDNAQAVNMEQIYKWNPEIIFLTNFTKAMPSDIIGSTIGNYNWSKIDAVINKKVYKMPLGMYRSYTPGVDTPITLLWLAKTTYPELFEDINITTETINYYSDVFGVKLTEQQAEKIFNPSKNAGYDM